MGKVYDMQTIENGINIAQKVHDLWWTDYRKASIKVWRTWKFDNLIVDIAPSDWADGLYSVIVCTGSGNVNFFKAYMDYILDLVCDKGYREGEISVFDAGMMKNCSTR